MRLPHRAARGLGPNFRGLWTATALSNLSDGIFLVALPLVAVELTRSPVLVSLAPFALTLPWLTFALAAGVLADRMDRRWLMITASLGRVLVISALGVVAWFDQLHLALLYLGAFLLGSAETFFDTSSQSIVPALVERQDLSRANGRIYAARVVMNQFVGSPLGGALVAVAVTTAFLAPAGLYLAAATVMWLISGTYSSVRGRRGSLVAEAREGLVHLWRVPYLRRMAVFAGTANLASWAFMSVFVLFAVGAASRMHLSEYGYGILLTMLAVGAVVGSFIVEPLQRRWTPAVLLTGATVVDSIASATPVLTANPVVVGAAFVILGVSATVASVLITSLRQRFVPDELLGRVNASFALIGRGATPVGAVLGGAIAAAIAPRGVFLVVSALSLLLAFVTARVRVSHPPAQRYSAT